MLEDITNIIRDYKSDPTLTITPQTSFSSLDLDSLESVELVMKIEEKLGVTIDMNGEINTIADILTIAKVGS